MANWCGTILRVFGPEPDVAGFVAYVEQEDEERAGSLTQMAECCLEQRSSGRANYEVLTRWRPPLDQLTEASSQFPAVTLHLEWDQPGDELLGCAVIKDGNRNVLELDDLVRNARETLRVVFRQQFLNEWDDIADEADLVLGREILREASRLHCGDPGDAQAEREDRWRDVRAFARQVVRDFFGAVKQGPHCWQKDGF